MDALKKWIHIIFRGNKPTSRQRCRFEGALIECLFLVAWGLLSWRCLGVDLPHDSTPADDKASKKTELRDSIERGHESFYTYGCWHCHTLGDEEAPGLRNGLIIGPDLADVGNRLSTEELLQSMIDPNAAIPEPKQEYMENGLSKMPSFNDPAAMADIRDMVRFLEQCKIAEKKNSNILEVTDASFKDLMEEGHEGFVLLDFWAEWCFACYDANPALEAVAPEFSKHWKVFKIEVDENPVLVDKYVPDLMFPCFVILHKGKVIDRKYGLDKTMDAKDFFRKWLSKHERNEK